MPDLCGDPICEARVAARRMEPTAPDVREPCPRCAAVLVTLLAVDQRSRQREGVRL